MKLSYYSIRKWIIVLLAIFTTQVYSQNNKKYPSLFWEVSGNGLKTPSYLYGSMHVSNKVAFHLSDTFFVALKSVEMVALEENPENFLEIYNYFAELYSGSDRYTRNYYSYGKENQDGFYGDAFKLDCPTRQDIISYLSGDNHYINQLLYRYNSYDKGNDEGDFSDNFSESTYLDLFVYQAAKKYGKSVINLEDFLTSFDLEIKAMKPDKESKKYDYSDGENYSNYNIFDKIEDAYVEGDLDLLDSLNKLTNRSKNFHKYFIEERNKNMVNRMDSLLKKGISVFTIIGAAHLPGNLGAIELLRSKGYTVRPVHKYLVNKCSAAMKDLEAKKVKITNSLWQPSDSTFEVSVPGKLSLMPNSTQNRFYLYPDMANGSYYFISRIPTVQFLNHHSTDYVLSQIDSSLYQGIPGEILSKKNIDKEGFMGYDIVNKTKRGDYQRYQIIVTPLEIVIFKMGGINKYVKEEGDAFFNSIHFEKSKALKSIGSGEKGYALKVNDGYTLTENLISGYENTRTSQILQSIDSAQNYSLMIRSSYHDYDYIEDDKFELGMLAYNFVKDKGCKLLDSIIVFNQGKPSLVMKYQYGANDYLHLKIIISGPFYYLLASVSSSSNVPSVFLNSSFLGNHKCDNWVMHTDTTLHFSAEIPESSVPKGVDLKSIYQNLSSFYGDPDQIKSYESSSADKIYRYAPNDDAVSVKYYRYNKYKNFKDIDEFWKKVSFECNDYFGEFSILSSVFSKFGSSKDSLWDMNPKFKMLHQKKYKEGNNEIFEYILMDSLSTRGIKTKHILKNGELYTLKTCIDTTEGMTEFNRRFFESFKPADTLLGTDNFADKAEIFFKNINATDTNLVREALESILSVDFADKDLGKIAKILKSFDFNKWGMSYKLNFIDVCSTMKSDSTLPLFRELYVNAGDTSAIKFQVLESLAKSQTSKSYELINSLLQEDIPFDDNSSGVENLFDWFSDSLELSAKLFPMLLNHTRYEDYRDNIYGLLSELTDSNKFQPEKYKSFIKEIITDGNKELKATISDENDFSSSSSNNYYSDNDYNYGNDMNEELYNYASILMPFYSDAQAKSFIDKTLNTNNKDLKLSLNVLMLKYKIAVSDTVWDYFAKSEDQCASLYRDLKKIGRIDKFPSKYGNQDHIVSSLLTNSNYDSKKDSLVFLCKKIVKDAENPKDSGYLYFFKVADKEKMKWKLAYCGIQPLDSTLFNAEKPLFIKVSRETLPSEQVKIDEEISDSVRTLGLKNRERTGYSSKYDYDYDY
jgi:uncharacterized protein YbaP (TraB family)